MTPHRMTMSIRLKRRPLQLCIHQNQPNEFVLGALAIGFTTLTFVMAFRLSLPRSLPQSLRRLPPLLLTPTSQWEP